MLIATVGPTPERSVSCRPGAEGALVEEVTWDLECPDGGATRIA